MKLPNNLRLSISNVDDLTKENILQEIDNSPSFLVLYTDKKNNCNLFHTGSLEDNYATVLALLHRHISFFDFFKSVIMNVEKYRSGGELEGLNFTPKALNYLNWRKRNFNQSKTYVKSLSIK